MRVLLTAVVLLCIPQIATAELQPDEVAIVAIKNSKKSIALAEYYADARKIPRNQICLIEATAGDVLPRQEWETSVRPAIRHWVVENKLETKIRCLVTVWDVPLKIGKADKKSQVVGERIAYLEGEKTNRKARLREMISIIDGVLIGTAKPRSLPPKNANLKTLVQGFEAAFKAASKRVLPVKDTPEGKKANLVLANSFTTGVGLTALLKNYQAQQVKLKQPNPTLDKQAATAAGQLAGLRDGRLALESIPESVERDQQILAIMGKSNGLVATLAWIDGQQKLLEKNETYASFDSELSLLYWPAYPLGRWQANVLHHSYDGSYTRWLRKTLMVSRLEAPTFELTKQLIDTAIKVEREGLDGKIYLDARGLAKRGQPYQRGSSQDFDATLLNLESVLKKHAGQTVILDTNKALFQPGEAPMAALYCGWYSLSNYVDAFQWQPGAVGYHMASGEASTLRKPTSRVWCKRMLEEGVCATLGPVYEPYLTAFPRPNEFFPLLLSGRHTLVECYYRTKLFNSWVMVLVGDPLYSPYRRNPAIAGKDLPPGLKRLIEAKPTWQP